MTKSVIVLSVVPFIKTSDEHGPHTTIARLVVDDITDACQSQISPGQLRA